MTKVNADHSSSLHVDHEVGQMAITNPEDPVTDTEQSVRAGEVRAQREEGLRAVTHLQKRSPGKEEDKWCKISHHRLKRMIVL